MNLSPYMLSQLLATIAFSIMLVEMIVLTLQLLALQFPIEILFLFQLRLYLLTKIIFSFLHSPMKCATYYFKRVFLSLTSPNSSPPFSCPTPNLTQLIIKFLFSILIPCIIIKLAPIAIECLSRNKKKQKLLHVMAARQEYPYPATKLGILEKGADHMSEYILCLYTLNGHVVSGFTVRILLMSVFFMAFMTVAVFVEKFIEYYIVPTCVNQDGRYHITYVGMVV